MLAEHLEDLGVNTETAKAKAASVKTRHRSRTPSTTRGRSIPFMDEEEGADGSHSRSRRRPGCDAADIVAARRRRNKVRANSK